MIIVMIMTNTQLVKPHVCWTNCDFKVIATSNFYSRKCNHIQSESFSITKAQFLRFKIKGIVPNDHRILFQR